MLAGVNTRCAWAVRSVQGPVFTDDVTHHDWLHVGKPTYAVCSTRSIYCANVQLSRKRGRMRDGSLATYFHHEFWKNYMPHTFYIYMELEKCIVSAASQLALLTNPLVLPAH